MANTYPCFSAVGCKPLALLLEYICFWDPFSLLFPAKAAPKTEWVLPSSRPALGMDGSSQDPSEFITNIDFKGCLPSASVSRVIPACLEMVSKQRARPLKGEGRGRCIAIYLWNREENLPVILANKYKLEAWINPRGFISLLYQRQTLRQAGSAPGLPWAFCVLQPGAYGCR